MLRMLQSYWQRTKRTPVRIIIWLCPLVFALVCIAYMSSSPAIKGHEVDAFFEGYAIVASFSISFFVPMLYEIDQQAGRYGNELRSGISRTILFIARFLFIALLLAVIELLAVLPFLMFLLFTGITVHIFDFLCLLALCLITLMSIIPTYQFLSLKFQYSGSIGLGAFFTLASLLLGTTELGQNIWYFFPYVYPIKLVFSYAKQTLSLEELMMFGVFSIFFMFISLFLFSFWYNKWDGTVKLEE
ncbi:lantibiotic ABC transporter permease [Streptococcus marmotae]|uniref:lantibiotic ABC transporter permease n=1 Tax=Streptococcus marmotae TaxID=1825069 RepID=UPI00082CF357|nr:lantibiotic ABC transporter permease [Streptococcus marmotae]